MKRKPLLIKYDDRYEKPWYLEQGGRWWYDQETRIHIRFASEREAIDWALRHLGEMPVSEDDHE